MFCFVPFFFPERTRSPLFLCSVWLPPLTLEAMERSSSSLIHCSCLDLSDSDSSGAESFSAPGLRATSPELPWVGLGISTFKPGISGRIHVYGRENKTRALTK
eukprot:1007504-Prorocentrum_minimum.AAC.1